MAIHYYITASTEEIDADGVSVIQPILPNGVGSWSGMDVIGRGCFLVASLDAAVVPVLGDTLSISDMLGLTDEQFYSSLPIEVPTGLTQEEVDGMADAVGFQRISLEVVRSLGQ